MKITLLEIHDFKRLKDVTIEPGERSVVLIGGNNTHGKSSLLGAMSAALGGKKEVPEDPIRHGAKKASIRVVFDDGELQIRRKFTTKGSTIEVTSEGGKISSPQKMLDKIVGSRFIDPMAFTRLSAKEQRETILGCVDLDIDLDDNIAAEKRAYDERRDANREAKKLKAKLDGFPDIGDIPDERDPAEINSRILALQENVRGSRDARGEIAGFQHEVRHHMEALEEAREVLVAARNRVKLCTNGLSDATEEAEGNIPILAEEADREEEYEEAIQLANNELGECVGFNTMVAARKAAIKQREDLEAEFAEASESSESLTGSIEALRDKRTEALSNATMPIDGLSFDEDGLILGGTPFSQASGAEKLRASIGIAYALQPELQDIWVEDGALLDEDSLVMVEEFATENDLRVWLERVGDSDDEAIIMVDGEVKP